MNFILCLTLGKKNPFQQTPVIGLVWFKHFSTAETATCVCKQRVGTDGRSVPANEFKHYQVMCYYCTLISMSLEEKGHNTKVSRISKHEKQKTDNFALRGKFTGSTVQACTQQFNFTDRDKSASGVSLVKGSSDFHSFIAQILHAKQQDMGFKAA